MTDINIHFLIYDDLPLLQRALEHVPDDITVYVLDGRYCDFDGETDLTPHAEETCGQYRNVRYHAPPDELLPFGDPEMSAYRSSNHEKARWAYYDVLPQDEWTIHLDTDEILVHLNREAFEFFGSDLCYQPAIYARNHTTEKQSRLLRTNRIFRPGRWSFWVDDLPVPRGWLSRDEEDLQEIKRAYTRSGNEYLSQTRDVVIYNRSEDRPADYQRRRADQLERYQRTDRARQVRK